MLRRKFGLLLISVVCLALILIDCGSGSDAAPIPPALTILKSHVGNFPPGQAGAEYTIQIMNTGGGPTSGTVTVTDTVPAGLTATNITGTGWACTLGSVSCNRSDPLPPDSSYSNIIVTVSNGKTLESVTNQATVSGGGAPTATASDPTTIGPGQINHVVIIIQENRTPDNLFHDPNLIAKGADIAIQGLTSSGAMIPLTPVSLVTSYDLGHEHHAFVQACDYNPTIRQCAMDRADKDVCNPSADCPPNPEYQYVQQSDVQPYFTMAETYTFGDRMFQTNQGPSFPAHQYIISGTSAISEMSAISVADNPFRNARPDGTYWAGCLAPPGSEVNSIDTSNPDQNTNQSVITQLCYEHPTLTDLLDMATPPISWKYYAAMPGSIWTAPDAIQHMCVPSSADGKFDDTVCSGSDWTNSDPRVVMEGSGAQIITDISNGQLAAVSWVIPTGSASDHAAGNDGSGPSWVASIVNAIGESPYWGNTAIIVAWDDWGGWYDHVPPPNLRDSYEYGLRVPLIVISAYAKPAYISHVTHDFGSILKFTETVFGLGEIDPTVGYADSRSDDLSDCFHFNQVPLVFRPIPAPLDANYFLNDKSPPTPPDND